MKAVLAGTLTAAFENLSFAIKSEISGLLNRLDRVGADV
jgi:hypothetical protein